MRKSVVSFLTVCIAVVFASKTVYGQDGGIASCIGGSIGSIATFTPYFVPPKKQCVIKLPTEVRKQIYAQKSFLLKSQRGRVDVLAASLAQGLYEKLGLVVDTGLSDASAGIVMRATKAKDGKRYVLFDDGKFFALTKDGKPNGEARAVIAPELVGFLTGERSLPFKVRLGSEQKALVVSPAETNREEQFTAIYQSPDSQEYYLGLFSAANVDPNKRMGMSCDEPNCGANSNHATLAAAATSTTIPARLGCNCSGGKCQFCAVSGEECTVLDGVGLICSPTYTCKPVTECSCLSRTPACDDCQLCIGRKCEDLCSGTGVQCCNKKCISYSKICCNSKSPPTYEKECDSRTQECGTTECPCISKCAQGTTRCSSTGPRGKCSSVCCAAGQVCKNSDPSRAPTCEIPPPQPAVTPVTGT